MRNVGYDNAVGMWRLMLSRYPLLENWIRFLESRDRKNDIPKDIWTMLLEFLEKVTNNGLQAYDPDGPWPVLIDEFVEYLNS